MQSHRWSSLADGRLLVLVVVLGGLVTLQSSNNLDASKVAYLLLVAVSLVGAAVGARWWLSDHRAEISAPWLASVASFAALLVLSLAVSRAHNTPMSSWLRDAATYALWAVAPVFGLACARTASRRWIIAFFVVCGSLASISFTVVWLGRRNLLDLPIARIVLPTAGLDYALLALATALALAGAWRRSWWAIGAGTVLGLFFVTGTRTSLLLLAVPIGAGLIAGRPWRRAARTLMTEGVVAVAIFFAAATGISLANGTLTFPIGLPGPTVSAAPSGAPMTSPQPTAPPNELVGRVNTVGSLLTNPGADQSLQERLSQTKAAWQAFLTSPLVGVGPGYTFPWTGSSGLAHNDFTLDTPLVYIAKFGLVGLIPLLLFAAAYLRLTRELWRRRPRTEVELLAVAGYGIVLCAISVLGAPMEDKGVSFAIILLVGLGCRALIRDDQEESSETRLSPAAMP